MRVTSLGRKKLLAIFGATCAVFAQVVFGQACWAQPTKSGTASEPRKVDDRLVEAAGIRKLQGRYLTLYTDVRGLDWVDELPEVFDQAVERWCEYFSIDPRRAADWRVRAPIIADMRRSEPFRASGLLPADLPPFPAGFHRRNEIWIYLQEGDYYTRHLLLHEGTHAFMVTLTGGTGPPWYSEGMAELLGLHRWQDGELTLGHRVGDKSEVPYWGRPKIIREDVSERHAMTIRAAMEMEFQAFLKVRSYAWAWAVCHFFDNHPKYQDHFRRLRDKTREVSAEDFNREFVDALRAEWPAIAHQWQLFLTEMDYGYDVARAAPVAAERSTEGDVTSVTIKADRGWQATGVQIEPDKTYVIDADGRFQVAHEEKPWESEPGGVTIQYYHGRPLGQLIGAVVDPQERLSGFLRPVGIGLGGEFQFDGPGQLYLRINDSPARWDDNRGSCDVKIRVK